MFDQLNFTEKKILKKQPKTKQKQSKKLDNAQRTLSSQIHLYDYKVVITYILLKIQNGDWKIHQNIMSENYLAFKLNCPKSKIHNIMLTLQSAQIIHSVPCKSWVVNDFIENDSILNIDFYNQPFDFRISISQTWSASSKEIKCDNDIFQEIIGSKNNLKINKLFYCKKVFYVENTTEKTTVIKYGFVKDLFYNLHSDSSLIKNNIIKFLAINGHAIFRKVRKFVINFEQHEEVGFKPILKIYEVIYNQNNEIILIIKKTHSIKSAFNHLVYTYKIQ